MKLSGIRSSDAKIGRIMNGSQTYAKTITIDVRVKARSASGSPMPLSDQLRTPFSLRITRQA